MSDLNRTGEVSPPHLPESHEKKVRFTWKSLRRVVAYGLLGTLAATGIGAETSPVSASNGGADAHIKPITIDDTIRKSHDGGHPDFYLDGGEPVPPSPVPATDAAGDNGVNMEVTPTPVPTLEPTVDGSEVLVVGTETYETTRLRLSSPSGIVSEILPGIELSKYAENSEELWINGYVMDVRLTGLSENDPQIILPADDEHNPYNVDIPFQELVFNVFVPATDTDAAYIVESHLLGTGGAVVSYDGSLYAGTDYTRVAGELKPGMLVQLAADLRDPNRFTEFWGQAHGLTGDPTEVMASKMQAEFFNGVHSLLEASQAGTTVPGSDGSPIPVYMDSVAYNLN